MESELQASIKHFFARRERFNRIPSALRFSLMSQHLIVHFPMSLGVSEWANEQTNKNNGVREWSKQCRASEWVSSGSEWMNGRASGPVLTSRFLVVLNNSAPPSLPTPFFFHATGQKIKPHREVVNLWFCLWLWPEWSLHIYVFFLFRFSSRDSSINGYNPLLLGWHSSTLFSLSFRSRHPHQQP